MSQATITYRCQRCGLERTFEGEPEDRVRYHACADGGSGRAEPVQVVRLACPKCFGEAPYCDFCERKGHVSEAKAIWGC